MDNPWKRGEEPYWGPAQPTDPVQLKPRPKDAQAIEQQRFAGQAIAREADDADRSELYSGSGNFINLGLSQAAAPQAAAGDITLNFQGTEISEVVKTILGDILQQNYALDDRVQGTVYLQTSQPIAREALIPTLENILRINGAALVRTNNFYEIVPGDGVSGSTLSPKLKLSADRGYQMLIVPLRYISAKEVIKILEPIKPRNGAIEADERRNLLTLAGTQEELLNLRETIRMFDVDQLKGMSVGLFRLKNVEPQMLMEELEAIFGDQADGPLAGMVRYVPIERLNALLVITPQRKYLLDARAWIDRLDRAALAGGQNLYVYYVQNGRAESMANLLDQLFEGQRRSQRNAAARSARAEPPPQPASGDEAPAERSRAAETVAASRGATSLDVGDVSIIADNENNALLIMASPSDYDKVLKAVEKLDVVPLQVLVEATIVEVTLEDELQYGLQWFFKNKLNGLQGRGSQGQMPIASPFGGGIATSAAYEVFDAAGTRLLLNTLAADSKVNVVSSPSLMVLDNHTATIRVGDQVPVRTSETTNTSGATATTATTTSALVTSQIQFKDTGVLLEVTPRVNAGGMVVLDIAQEVNDVDQTTTSGIDSPTITQRKINTSVAVQSGETLVLGGLIKENRDRDSNGLPGVRHVPVLGWLFGSEGKRVARTELVVLITPTAVTNQEEAREVTEEYRRKLKGVTLPERILEPLGQH